MNNVAKNLQSIQTGVSSNIRNFKEAKTSQSVEPYRADQASNDLRVVSVVTKDITQGGNNMDNNDLLIKLIETTDKDRREMEKRLMDDKKEMEKRLMEDRRESEQRLNSTMDKIENKFSNLEKSNASLLKWQVANTLVIVGILAATIIGISQLVMAILNLK